MTFRNPNLVPTPIVNRNGVATTVHRKLSGSGQAQVAAFAKNGPPSPSASQPSDESAIDGIALSIRSLPSFPDSSSALNELQREKLRATAHIEGHLQRVNDLFSGLHDDAPNGYLTATFLLMNVNLADTSMIRLLNAYKDDFRDSNADWRAAARLGADLVANGITALDSNDRIATLPAHIKANEEYEKAVSHLDLESWEGPDKDIIRYPDNAPYAATVEKYANDIDKILDYRGDPEDDNARGYKDSMRGGVFDVDAFEEYLSLGVLGDGSL